MAERWSVVTGGDALSYAGTPAQTFSAENVTYVLGPSATLVIVDAGDRPDGNAVHNVEELVLHAPIPDAVETRLGTAQPPTLGFVRVAEGYVPLGKLIHAVSHLKSIEDGGKPYPFGGRAKTIWCKLRITDRLGFDLLDRVRPMPQQPLPGVDWLRLLKHHPIAAMGDYMAGWYADIPPVHEFLEDPREALPEPLVAFYRAAAGREEVFGRQNRLFTAAALEYEEDGRIMFAAENQGVFVVLMDPAESDPIVSYAGINVEDEEPLSTFLLQFLLLEASCASPFSCFATVTAEQASRLVESLHRVPLPPMRWPVDPTRHYVAPGLVVTTGAYADGSVEVYGGSRQRRALRSLRDPGFAWDRFDG